MFRQIPVRARHQNAKVRMMRAGIPNFLTINEPVIRLSIRPG